MSAPLPSLFPSVASYSDTVCTHLERATQFDVAFTAFYKWAFNADGSFSDNWAAFIQAAATLGGCADASTTTSTTTAGTGSTTTTVSTSSTSSSTTTYPTPATPSTTTFAAPLPAALTALVPKMTGSLCDFLNQRNNFDESFLDFYRWMVDDNGNPTPAFAAQVCAVIAQCG